jgi:carbon-monoxide dehydrogenase large subunit
MNNRDGTPMLSPVRYALAADKVRYVGDPVAAVVAETVAEAKEAAEAVVVDIDPLPAVTSACESAMPGAPLLYDDVPGNVGLDFHYGDSDKVAAAFAGAAHVTRLALRNNRIVVNPMEPRAAVAAYDPGRQHWTLHIGSQGVFGFRNYIANVFGVGRDKMRVLTGRVGGSFGMKQPTYAEHFCIMHAARELGRPVKWTDERSGSFVSDTHGRDAEMTAELALDRDGNFLAVRLTGYGNLGATYGAPGPPTRNAVRKHARRLQDPADRGLDEMRVHEYDAGRGVSRRRPARGQLLHGAAGGRGGCRDRDRSCRITPPQPHPARGDAV